MDVSGEMIRVTISLGAVFSLPGEETEAVVKRADGLLYQAKETGRNRVVMDNRCFLYTSLNVDTRHCVS